MKQERKTRIHSVLKRHFFPVQTRRDESEENEKKRAFKEIDISAIP